MTTLPNVDEPAPPPADDLYADVPGILTGDALDATVSDYQQGGSAGWQIEDDATAEWAMAKLAEAQGDVDALLAQRDAQMERAQAWYARVSKVPQRTAGFMQAHLMDYAIRRREAGKGATLVLPNGDVATRKGPEPAVVIADEAAVIEWARKAHPEVVDTSYKVLVSKLRTVATAKGDVAVDTNGEVVPGTAVREAGDPTATVNPY
jgi:phage host-nuclease inhibitor protein Gam